jgi:hypothetical protein
MFILFSTIPHKDTIYCLNEILVHSGDIRWNTFWTVSRLEFMIVDASNCMGQTYLKLTATFWTIDSPHLIVPEIHYRDHTNSLLDCNKPVESSPNSPALSL